MMRHTPGYWVLIGVTAALAPACALARQNAPATVGPAASPTTVRQASGRAAPSIDPTTVATTAPLAPDERYRLRGSDVLELRFPFVPDFNQIITVQPDGYVTLPLLGTLRVEGMTVPELTQALRASYSSILRDPVVTVALKEFERPYFIVAGEVAQPGKYDLRSETTVTQAVAVAGGLTERAKHSRLVVFRRLPAGGFEAKQLDLKEMMKEAQLNRDVRLQPGDMVFIPKGRNVDISALMSSLWVLGFLY